MRVLTTKFRGSLLRAQSRFRVLTFDRDSFGARTLGTKRADGFGVIRGRVDRQGKIFLDFEAARGRNRLVVELDDVEAIEHATATGR